MEPLDCAWSLFPFFFLGPVCVSVLDTAPVVLLCVGSLDWTLIVTAHAAYEQVVMVKGDVQ